MRNWLLILGLLIPITTTAAQAVMQGFPPTRENQAHLSNFMTPPFSHWAMHNPSSMLPSQRIPREGANVPIKESIMHSLGDVEVAEGVSFKQAFADHFADGVLVLHKGVIVYEQYFNGMKANDHHIWYSMTKSLASAAFGILVEQGQVDLAKSPADYIPELKGSAYERTTIQNVLDHMSALNFKENYTDYSSPFIRFYAPTLNLMMVPGARDELPKDTDILGTWDFAVHYAKPDPNLAPGEAFDYNSNNADVLGWLVARISGLNFADFVQQHIWSKLAVDHDAAMVVDRALMPVATGGMMSTLRDASRFGQMILQKGEYLGQQIIPKFWVDEITNFTPHHVEAMKNNTVYQDNDWVAYHNMWWQLDKSKEEFAATGVHGQVIYINRDADTVITYFSSQPNASAARNPNYQAKLHAARFMADYLSAE